MTTSGPSPEARKYAEQTDDDQLACRAGQHDWPKPRPGRPLPGNFQPRRQHDGCYRVTEICGVCGKKRFTTTFPGGIFDLDATYSYDDPEHWQVIPREVGMSKRVFKAELYRRLNEEIVAAAERAGNANGNVPMPPFRPGA